MRGSNITIRETINIPPQTRERFLDLTIPSAKPLTSFHVNMGGLSELSEGYEIGRVNSTHHQLLYTIGGTGRFYTPDSTRVLRAGQLVTIPGGSTYGYVMEGKSWSIMWFHFELDDSLWFLQQDEINVQSSLHMPLLQAATHGYLVESLRNSASAQHAARLYGELIVYYIDRDLGQGEDPVTRKVHERLYQLWDRVNGSLPHEWNVAEMAKIMHMSSVHLHRTCLKYTGMSPMQKVTHLRMQRAEALLRQDYPIKSVSEMVGYSSPYAFSVAFKRHTGMSPGKIKKKSTSQRLTDTHED